VDLLTPPSKAEGHCKADIACGKKERNPVHILIKVLAYLSMNAEELRPYIKRYIWRNTSIPSSWIKTASFRLENVSKTHAFLNN
jgi:hypothetical protein